MADHDTVREVNGTKKPVSKQKALWGDPVNFVRNSAGSEWLTKVEHEESLREIDKEFKGNAYNKLKLTSFGSDRWNKRRDIRTQMYRCAY
jgi:hypothetical protein